MQPLRSSSNASSISAPRSDGNPDSSSYDGGEGLWDPLRSVEGAEMRGIGAVHTGFTSSSASTSAASATSSRRAGGPPLSSWLQPGREMPGGISQKETTVVAAPHTGFTSSSSSSAASSSCSSYSSAQGAKAAQRAARTQEGVVAVENPPCRTVAGGGAYSDMLSRYLSGAASRRGSVPIPTSLPVNPLGTGAAFTVVAVAPRVPASQEAHPVSSSSVLYGYLSDAVRNVHDHSSHSNVGEIAFGGGFVGLSSSTLAATAGELSMPRKADATPRRKGTSPNATHRASGVHRAGTTTTDYSHTHLSSQFLPPSTLLDLQMNLGVLSDTQLAVRLEELTKELRRTQQEMSRRRPGSSSTRGGDGADDEEGAVPVPQKRFDSRVPTTERRLLSSSSLSSTTVSAPNRLDRSSSTGSTKGDSAVPPAPKALADKSTQAAADASGLAGIAPPAAEQLSAVTPLPASASTTSANARNTHFTVPSEPTSPAATYLRGYAQDLLRWRGTASREFPLSSSATVVSDGVAGLPSVAVEAEGEGVAPWHLRAAALSPLLRSPPAVDVRMAAAGGKTAYNPGSTADGDYLPATALFAHNVRPAATPRRTMTPQRSVSSTAAAVGHIHPQQNLPADVARDGWASASSSSDHGHRQQHPQQSVWGELLALRRYREGS